MADFKLTVKIIKAPALSGPNPFVATFEFTPPFQSVSRFSMDLTLWNTEKGAFQGTLTKESRDSLPTIRPDVYGTFPPGKDVGQVEMYAIKA
jgi:hypothetical protein